MQYTTLLGRMPQTESVRDEPRTSGHLQQVGLGRVFLNSLLLSLGDDDGLKFEYGTYMYSTSLAKNSTI